MGDIGRNMTQVQERIAEAALRSGREPSDVTLVAVTKTHPVETVVAAYQAGVRHFGENRVEEAEEKIDPHLQSMLKPWPPPKPKEDKSKQMREVILSLDGREHDLAVGYVAETPVWRPSYRLVVREDGHADLQAWGIVQNLSGEDWSEVKLALVAGAPLAFESTLGDPEKAKRPLAAILRYLTLLIDEILEAFPAGTVPPTEMVTLRSEEELEPYLKEPLSPGWKTVYGLPKIGQQ